MFSFVFSRYDAVFRFVWSHHPSISNYYRWTDGGADYTHLYCGGEVRQGVTLSEEDTAHYWIIANKIDKESKGVGINRLVLVLEINVTNPQTCVLG